MFLRFHAHDSSPCLIFQRHSLSTITHITRDESIEQIMNELSLVKKFPRNIELLESACEF